MTRAGHFVRRGLHCAFGLVCIYYLVPPVMLWLGPFPITRAGVLLALYVTAIGIEVMRLSTRTRWFLLRDHETDRVASWFWFSSGAVLLIFIAPQQIAAPVILSVAFADPAIGELRIVNRGLAITAGCAICGLIFVLFHYPLTTALLIALVAVGAEAIEIGHGRRSRNSRTRDQSAGRVSDHDWRRRIMIWDDDLVMQLIPASFLAIIFGVSAAVGSTILLPPAEPLLQPLYDPFGAQAAYWLVLAVG